MENELNKNSIRSGVPIPDFNSKKKEEIVASMKKMKINDYIGVDRTIRTLYYNLAKIAGIKVTVRLLDNGMDYGCWRVEDEK